MQLYQFTILPSCCLGSTCSGLLSVVGAIPCDSYLDDFKQKIQAIKVFNDKGVWSETLNSQNKRENSAHQVIFGYNTLTAEQLSCEQQQTCS